MFRCTITGKMSQLGEAQHKVVIERRPKEYHGWRLDEEEDEYKWVKIGEGWEIAKEVSVCEDGLKLWDSWTEDQRVAFANSLKRSVVAKKEEPKRRVVR
jgi:hypothetical protein